MRFSRSEIPLRAQLMALVGGLMALAVAGMFYIHVHSTRVLLSEQLARHAQDTATALGLTLSRELAANDVLLLESVVDAAFDPGYFLTIDVQLEAPLGNISRARSADVDGVPAWFADWMRLDPPAGIAPVMQGWSRAGEVRTAAHPAFAYERLWAATLDAAGWAAVSFALAFLFTSILIAWLLEPLGRVERQAVQITNGQFPELDTNARSRDLSRLLHAVGVMTARLQQTAREQHRRVEELRDANYVDALTGLGNARAFARALADVSGNPEEHEDGLAVLLQLGGLDTANADGGLGAGDAWLKGEAMRMHGIAAQVDGTAVRFAGALFGLVVPGSALEAPDDWLAELKQHWPDGQASFGATWFVQNQAVDMIQRRVENALEQARGGASDVVLDVDGHPAKPRDGESDPSWWREQLPGVLERADLPLATQPVVTVNARRVVHREVLARMPGPDGEPVNAGVFIPIAARLGLLPSLDRLVIETLLSRMQNRGATLKFAVNVSVMSVLDDAFVAWLEQTLAGAPHCQRVTFELRHADAFAYPEKTAAFAARLRALNTSIALDHVGAEHLDLSWLQSLTPRYLKLDGGFARNLSTDAAQQDYVRSLVALAHTLDAQLIAEHVQSADDVAALARLRVDAVQGFAIGPPTPFS